MIETSSLSTHDSAKPAHTRDTEFSLSLGDETVVVSPFGASLRRYFKSTPQGEWNLIWGYENGANKRGGQGDVLIPFPGRIKDGTFKHDGKTLSLEKNDKDGPNAIHGFLRSTLFDVQSISKTHATFVTQISERDHAVKGYPFTIDVEVSYELSALGLKTSFRLLNAGNKSAPVGAGFHPYFCADQGELKDWIVQIPAGEFIELKNLVPTGQILPVAGTHLDFRSGRLVGAQTYNDCLAKLERNDEGFAEITIRFKESERKVQLTLDRSFDYVVIYTGDQIPAPHARQGFAIEPMTCAPDAFNHSGWGTQNLAPGQELSGSYTVSAR